MRGPTPPNVYDLTLREEIFHGVRAIRLNPVDDDKMYGRAGMLAHTYMLGPNGQSNGCVSFSDYDKFLRAFLKGQVDRMVVVAALPRPPRMANSGATTTIATPPTIKSDWPERAGWRAVSPVAAPADLFGRLARRVAGIALGFLLSRQR